MPVYYIHVYERGEIAILGVVHPAGETLTLGEMVPSSYRPNEMACFDMHT